MTDLKIGYWSIRGLGAPLRMMAMYSNTPFNCVNYDLREKDEGGWDASSWFDEKKQMIEANPLLNLPYVIDGDLIISQSNACFLYLGRKFNMLGSTEMETIQCEQLLCEVMDLRNKIVTYSYETSEEEVQEKGVNLLNNILGKNGIFQKFESWLAREVQMGRSGTFLVGNKASAPDFHLWEMLDQYKFLQEFLNYSTSIFEKFPLLCQFHINFAALPENSRYFSSPLSKLPINNKLAKFGSGLNGSRYTLGIGKDWNHHSGIY